MFVRIRIEYLFAILLALMGAGSAFGAWCSRTIRVFGLDEYAGTEHDVVVMAASAWAPGEFALLGLGGFLLLAALGLSLGGARERRREQEDAVRPTAPPR